MKHLKINLVWLLIIGCTYSFLTFQSCGIFGNNNDDDVTPLCTVDTDNDNVCDDNDTDDDNDGINDTVDPFPVNPYRCGDSDNDSCDDCSIGVDGFGPMADFNPENDGCIVTPPDSSPKIPDFKLCLKVWDGNGTTEPGLERCTNFVGSGSNQWSPFAMDANRRDPDALEITLNVNESNTISDKDYRVAIQFADHQSTGEFGNETFTPWTSEGGGWSNWACDANCYDPDAFRIKIESREWPNQNGGVKNLRVKLQLNDEDYTQPGNVVTTPWLLDGSGTSDLALDATGNDFDAARIGIEVIIE